ncbi:MAG TPA: SDR family oxidoreductase [Pontimonas sp.]|nr:SDR family oxidoreductase [Pontimonas sp.]
MTKSATDLIAVVTGGTSGIGLAIATRLSADGFRVVVTSRTPCDTPLPSGVRAVIIDHANAHSAEDLAANIAAHEGRVSVVVNNVGRRHNDLIGDYEPESLVETLTLNVGSPLLVTSALVGLFDPTGGAVINISSRLATVGMPGVSGYAATKGALNAYTKAAAIELAPRNIRVNAVAPGMTHTALIEDWLSDQADPGVALADTLAGIPLGRLAETGDIAAVVGFLASDAAAYLTGIIIPVDGGYTAA